MYLEYYFDYSLGKIGLDDDTSEQEISTHIRIIEWEKLYSSHDDFIDNYIRPRNLKHSLTMLFFDLDGKPAVAFSLDRLSDKPFHERDAKLLERIAQHLNNLYKNLYVRPQNTPAVWEDIPDADKLTAREREIVDLLCQGITPVNISRRLLISPGTTNKHIAHIYKKLGVGSRQELLVKALGN